MRPAVLITISILQPSECHTLVNLDTLHDILMVVVCLALHQVKTGKRLTLHARECFMNLVQQVEHL